MKTLFLLIVAATLTFSSLAGTIGTFQTSVGTWEIEFYDEDKPVTVSNFLKYASSGRFVNQFIHRWVPGFVIQGGGYRVETTNGLRVVPVETFGAITNEAGVGTRRSNTYGTIAMARSDLTNSATSQWFINLGDNSGPPPNLDSVKGGFTVFGRVISGTNILNFFVPPPPTHGIYIEDQIVVPSSPVPVLASTNLTFDDLVYVQLKFRREVDLEITRTFRGRQVGWTSVAGVTNILEYSSQFAAASWLPYTNIMGSGNRVQFAEDSNDPKRFYRVRLVY